MMMIMILVKFIKIEKSELLNFFSGMMIFFSKELSYVCLKV